MEVFRLAKKEYAAELNGKGAALRGARWNSAGTELIYTATNRSLAMAEVAVHFSLGTLPADYILMTIYVPDSLKSKRILMEELPSDWNRFPYPETTQAIGDKFVSEGACCILYIPSAVTYGDFNLLINPNHADFRHIKITDRSPFPFDNRIFKR